MSDPRRHLTRRSSGDVSESQPVSKHPPVAPIDASSVSWYALTLQQRLAGRRQMKSGIVRIAIFVACTCIALLQVLVPLHSMCLRNVIEPNVEKKTSLGDGCYHVFIDVGSNIGMHARFLFEPDKFPRSKTSVAALQQQFGLLRDNRDFW